jgi:hypothetical protein
MCGNSLHGNREIPEVPVDTWAGRPEKAKCRTSGMHASGKSDGCIVPEKPSNKGGLPAEMVEGRRPTKGNIAPMAVAQTQSWIAMSFCAMYAGWQVDLCVRSYGHLVLLRHTQGRSRMR